MKIYIAPGFKCHTSNVDGTYKEVETAFFDGKCDAFIEGYRFIPEGEAWTRKDGEVFTGEMITPWKPYAELEEAQRNYDLEKLREYEESLKVVGVTL